MRHPVFPWLVLGELACSLQDLPRTPMHSITVLLFMHNSTPGEVKNILLEPFGEGVLILVTTGVVRFMFT